MKSYAEAVILLEKAITTFRDRNVVLYRFEIMQRDDGSYAVIALERSAIGSSKEHSLQCTRASEVTDDNTIGSPINKKVFLDPDARVWKATL
ncbi:MAG TPA: hypothetical protein VGE62_01945 [Candidatus Paceibacterota bacterium]